MAIAKSSLVLGLLLILCGLPHYSTESNVALPPYTKIDRSHFSNDFYFGTSTSAYQIEGAHNISGKGPSIWDTFTHEHPERVADGSNGDVAVDFYNNYKEDIKNMHKELGMNAFRFSISWPRVVPSGRVKEGVNEEGIAFYNRVINEAIMNGLEPFVTIFHWDVPQALEDKYGGFLSPNIVADFKDFAELCFQRFGDKVKHWITLNEPYIFSTHGYESGDFAPGRCSYWVNRACQYGDSSTEPYIVAHNLLIAHAEAVHLYRSQYQKGNGKIGITLDVVWGVPLYNNPADNDANQRYLDFVFGWFMDPLTYGDYPRTMRTLLGNRLPKFTRVEFELVKKSYDFIGINSYTSTYTSANFTVDPNPNHIRVATDSRVKLTKYRDDKPIGKQATPRWLYVFPEGILQVLNYTKNTYKDPIIYITENGIGDPIDLTLQEVVKDEWRIDYHEKHLINVHRAICEYNVKVKGYFVWSFIDNIEWASGYSVRMGLYGVDRSNKDLTRHPKWSVKWFHEFLKHNHSHDHVCSFTLSPANHLEDHKEEL